MGTQVGTVLIDKLLDTVVTTGASDLHLSVGQPPVLRLNGRMRKLETKVLESDDTVALMKSITPERCQQELQEVGGCDFGFAFGTKGRFRIAVFKQKSNVSLVLRLIPHEFLTFAQLGTPVALHELIKRPRGLILVTGPTGSGKTTTLASCINWLNHNVDRHIITIEDPIEYYHEHNKCTINQREIGNDVQSFPEALRRSLRMDPDCILVGEMRDLETIEAAITAAETGHIVFGTLHTTGAEGTVNRIIDVFPTNQQEQIRTQLSVAVIGILSQALLPRQPKGMIAAYEMLTVTPAVSNLIRENKTYRISSTIQTGKKHGMIGLDESLFNLWQDGSCLEEDVVGKAHKAKELQEKITQAKQGVFTEDEDEDVFEDEEEGGSEK